MSYGSEKNSDYEAIFRQHIKTNVLLQNEFKTMDSIKRKKMLEFDREKERFLKQHGKEQNSTRHLTVPSAGPRARSKSPTASSSSRFLVSKHFPYSAKAWNALTDVSQSGLNTYRTEVLKTPEATVSCAGSKSEVFSEQKRTMRPRTHSFAGQRVTPINNSSDEGQQNKNKNPNNDDLFDIVDAKTTGFRRRSYTTPVFMREDFRNRSGSVTCSPGPVSGKRVQTVTISSAQKTGEQSNLTVVDNSCMHYTDSPLKGCSCECTMGIDSQSTNINSEKVEIPDAANIDFVIQDFGDNENIESKNVIVVKQASEEKSSDSTVNGKGAVGKSPDSVKINDDETKAGKGLSKQTSAESNFSSPNISPVARRRIKTMDDAFRKKRQSISSTASDFASQLRKQTTFNSDEILAKRRGSISSGRFSAGLECHTGFRRKSLFEKLLYNATCSAVDDKAKDTFTDLNKCRYIRAVGEHIDGSVEDVSLKNVDFRHASPVQEESSLLND